MKVSKKGVGCVLGSAVTLAAVMTAPVFADTVSADVTNEESILDTAAWSSMAATNVQSYANIRQEATVDSERVGVLLPGHAVEVTGKEGDWSRIKSGNVEGYVRNDLLVFGEEARVHYMNVCGFTGTVQGEGPRVRSEASTESSVVTLVENGSVLCVTGESEGWYQVSVDGTEAYVCEDYLELNGLDATALTLEEYQAQQEAKRAAEEAQAAAETSAQESAQTETAGETVTETSSVNVSSSELDLLAALIQCEAGGESRTGKVAVGAVIVNRVNSSSFPDNISDVIYQSGQFTPASSGKLSGVLAAGARSDCYEAAQAALNGENPIGSCLYFNCGTGKGIQIGNQHFY